MNGLLKKIAAITLAATLVTGGALCTAVTASAAGTDSASSAQADESDFKWTTDSNGEVYIYRYNYSLLRKSPDVVIPDTIDGKKVTRMSPTVFTRGCRSVTLPLYLREICDPTDINKITEEARPKDIEYYVLSSVIVPDGNAYFKSKDGVLYSKDMKKLLKLPAATEGTFSIPSTVTDIDPNAFSNCTQVTGLVIPSSVKEISGTLLKNFKSLETLTINNANYTLEDDVLYDKAKTKIIYVLHSKNVRFEIPSTVKTIGDFAFAGSNVPSVVLPEGLTEIGNYAFAECKITSVSIPSSVAEIGGFAFSNSSISTAKIYASVDSLSEGCFWGCESLSSVSFPDGLTEIENTCFMGCSRLYNPVLPSSLQKLGYLVFSNCSSITNMVIPESVKTIEDGTFNNCTKLRSVYFPGNPEFVYTDDSYI